MGIATVPRTIVRSGLRGLRLPLGVAETVARRAGIDVDDHWLPSVAYEGFEADAKRVLGSLLRDDELVEDGRRQRAKAIELRQALRLEAVAEGTRAQADAAFERRREAAAEQRAQISAAAKASRDQVQQERRTNKARIRQQAEHQERVIDQAAEARQEAAAKAQREARRRKLAEESAALAKEEQALELDEQAEALSAAEEQVRAQRKAEP